MHRLAVKGIQLAGKVRRFVKSTFLKGATLRDLSKRKGFCNRCGACCKLVFKCPAYKEENGEGMCLIYNDRPGVCALYPLDIKDIQELKKTMPHVKCDYYFGDESSDLRLMSELKQRIFGIQQRQSVKGTVKITLMMIKRFVMNGHYDRKDANGSLPR